MDLPDLRAKVKIDTSDVAVADAKVKAFSQSVRDSLDRTNVDSKLQQAGQAFVKFGKDGDLASVRISSSTAKTRADLDQLEARVKKFAEGIDKDFRKGSTAVLKLGDDGAASLSRFSAAMDTGSKSIPIISGLIDGISSLATKAFSPLVIAIAAATAILGPFIVEAVAATAIVSAFAVGLAATLAVIGLFVGGMGAMAAGVVALAAATGQLGDASGKGAASAAQLAQAQDALNKATKQYGANSYQAALAQEKLNQLQAQGKGALAELQAHVEGMAQALGKEALPAAQQVLAFLDQLIDPIQKIGSEALHWVGNVLPDALNLANRAVGPFLDDIRQMGRVFADFISQVFTRMPQFGPLLQGTVQVGIQAVQGLLTNLLRLSDWFMERMPAMAPIVGQIMGKIGDFIQGVGNVAGSVVDWFVAHWPQITETANGAWNNIKAGWDAFAPVLQKELPEAANLASQFMGYLHDHSDVVRAVFIALGLAAALLVGAIAAVGTIALGIISAIQFLYEKFNALMGVVDSLAGKAWGLVSALGAVADKASKIPGVGAVLGALTGGSGAALASGGPALPNSVYTVGENGPETLVMGQSGGYVIPHSGGGGASMGRTERLLSQQNELLTALLQVASASPPPAFSTRAYGRA